MKAFVYRDMQIKEGFENEAHDRQLSVFCQTLVDLHASPEKKVSIVTRGSHFENTKHIPF